MFGSDQKYCTPVSGVFPQKQRCKTANACALTIADCSRLINKVFKQYLFELVHDKEENFNITLQTSIPAAPSGVIMTTHRPGHNPNVHNLELRVLTPAFYSRFVHYTYTSEAIDRECVFTDEKNRTLWICRPQLLPLLLSERSSIPLDDQVQPLVKRSYLDELRWSLLRRLRCAPADPAYSMTPKSASFKIDDIRSRSFSELDNFVRSFRGNKHAAEYRRAVTKLFLAQRYFLGFPEIVGLFDLTVRVVLCFLGASQFGKLFDVPMSQMSIEKDWRPMLSAISAVLACHAYQMLKGYS